MLRPRYSLIVLKIKLSYDLLPEQETTMPDGARKQSSSMSPLPGFSFLVELRYGKQAKFAEGSGLDVDSPIEDRAGGSEEFYPVKMPGIGRVTMRKGVADKSAFWEWLSWVNSSTAEGGRTVTISLLDDDGAPRMVWRLHRAKITNASVQQDAVESVELSFEALDVKA